MSKTFREWNPEQTLMFPPTPMDWVSKDDVVLFIRNLILEELDLSEIEDQYQEERGYPPFHPSDDDGTGVVQLLSRDLLIAANRQSLQTASGLSSADRDADAGPPDGKSVPAAPFAGIEWTVSAGAGTM